MANVVRSYGLALGLMLVAVAARWLLDPLFGNSFRLIFLYGAVAFAVWRGGPGPALLVTLLGYLLSNYLFMGQSQTFDFSGDAFLGFAAYLFSCSIFIGLGEATRRAQRRTQEAVETRARLAAIVAASSDAIVSKSLDGTIRSWNAGAERLLGYSEAEIVGKHITTIIPPELHDEEDTILEHIRRGESVSGLDSVRLTKDGRRIDLSITVSPVLDDSGRVIGASKVARDITERKRAEQALQDADRRKDEFLATLAHELRNPLAPISYSLDILKHAEDNPELLYQARTAIERQLTHMVRLVDDLLNISRISRDKLTLRTSATELKPLIQQAVETVYPLLDERQHSLSLDLPEQAVYVTADSVRLAQVLSNLLTNACKYTECGGQITVSVTQVDNQVQIAVTDNGIGIAPEQLGSIFDMFSQVPDSLDRATGGLGIGLTLAKRLVTMHGGELTVRSDGLNQGSTFTVELPVLAQAVAEPPQTAPPGAQTAALRILVVDDNLDSAQTLATLLGLNGHEVELAHDGLAALDTAESFRPQLLLLDIGLPKLDGYSTCRQLRQRAWTQDLKIVALTGWGQDDDRRKTREAGFDAHLVKPVSYHAVAQLLRTEDQASAAASAL